MLFDFTRFPIFDPGSGYRFRSESAARFIFAALF